MNAIRSWSDNPAGLYTDVPVIGGQRVVIGSPTSEVTAIYVKDIVISGSEIIDGDETVTGNLDVGGDLTVTGDSTVTGDAEAAAFNLADGSDKNYPLSVYAAGTAYQLTNTAAALDFGTTDPSLTIDKAGTYLLLAQVNLLYNAATFAASQDVTLKLRRTNNTAADLTNGSIVVATDIITTLTYTFGVFNLPPVLYTTANVNDAITIFGDVAVVPGAGSLDAVAASLIAVRLS